MAFTGLSTAFSQGEAIPKQYTCDGADQALPVAWSGIPAGTAELALVMDDPDARGFVHWLVVGIPPTAAGLDGAALPAGAREGKNGFGRAGYGGPCPPSGTHHYVITLYALSAPLSLPACTDRRRASPGSSQQEHRHGDAHRDVPAGALIGH